MSKKPKGWYKALAIRPVIHVDGYESYEKVCGHVADIYFTGRETHHGVRLVRAYTLLLSPR